MVPVDLFGQMAEIERFSALMPNIPVVEDAAQSIGACRKIRGRDVMAGEAATIGTLSFFPTKNLGGYGDGGMIVTQDDALATRLRRLRVHGGAPRTFTMTGVQQPTRSSIACLWPSCEPRGWSSKRGARAFLRRCVAGVAASERRLSAGYGHLQPVPIQPSASDLAAYLKKKGSNKVLPAAAPPPTVLRLPGLQAGQLPGIGASGGRGNLAADLPRAHSGSARGDSRDHPLLLWQLTAARAKS